MTGLYLAAFSNYFIPLLIQFIVVIGFVLTSSIASFFLGPKRKSVRKLEIIFLYPWAVNFKELGLVGFIEMLTFILCFSLGFFYVLKKGVLNWND